MSATNTLNHQERKAVKQYENWQNGLEAGAWITDEAENVYYGYENNREGKRRLIKDQRKGKAPVFSTSTKDFNKEINRRIQAGEPVAEGGSNTYFVDPVNGSDSNNGLGPDASNATNKPWKTIAKVLGASGIASGDTCYLAPGVYREQVTISLAPTATTSVIGDPQNKQGFKDSSGVAVPAGAVIHSVWSNGDKASPPNGRNISASGKNFFLFQYILYVSNNQIGAYEVFIITGDSHDYTLLDCYLYTQSYASFVYTQNTFNVAANILIDRCVFVNLIGQVAVAVGVIKGTGTDFDIGVTIRNCLFIGGSIIISASGSGSNVGNGMKILNCTLFASSGVVAVDTNTVNTTATTFPTKVYNCLIIGGWQIVVRGSATGVLLEDYNIFHSNSTIRTNVTAGTHTIADRSYMALLNIGQERIFNGLQRPFLEPVAGSPILGYGNDGSQTSYDLRNNPRPAGGLSSLPGVGALERSNTWGQETATVRTGSNALSCVGPGYQDFLVPVDNTSTTISVYLRYNSDYAGTLPSLQLLQNDELGLSVQTATQVGSANTWEQVSVTFTASKNGFVTVRLWSQDTSGYGRALADDFAVA